ncbi:MAG: acyltransferase [Methylococcales bacterium]|nr:acyltransferase [Methylococcales bacterium]
MSSLLTIEINKKRIYGLDILRALAIFFVVLDHSTHTLEKSNSEIIRLISKQYSWYARYFVFDGVSIFFVLSGFLIGGILIKNFEKESLTIKSLLNFWIKRWVRTLPAYLFILTILVLLSYFFTADFNIHEVGKYYLFLQNFNTPHPNFFPEAWSLSVEEWFYLLIPSSIFFLSFFLKIPFRKSFIFSAIIVLLFSLFIRYYYFSNNLITSSEDWSLILRKQVITRLDSLMFGLIAAYIFFYKKEFWFKYKYLSFYLGLTMLLGNKYIVTDSFIYNYVFSFSITSIAVLLLLPFLNDINSGAGFIYKAFTYTSLISYSMYLLNLTVIQLWILKYFPLLITNDILLAFLKFFSYWFLTIFLSILMYKYIELPFMDLRSKLEIK